MYFFTVMLVVNLRWHSSLASEAVERGFKPRLAPRAKLDIVLDCHTYPYLAKFVHIVVILSMIVTSASGSTAFKKDTSHK